MKLPTIFHESGTHSGYPIKCWLYDTFSLLYRKKALMRSRGWYLGLSGKYWCGQHYECLSYKEFKNMSYDKLKKFIS
jgi:hypothetical protein